MIDDRSKNVKMMWKMRLKKPEQCRSCIRVGRVIRREDAFDIRKDVKFIGFEERIINEKALYVFDGGADAARSRLRRKRAAEK